MPQQLCVYLSPMGQARIQLIPFRPRYSSGSSKNNIHRDTNKMNCLQYPNFHIDWLLIKNITRSKSATATATAKTGKAKTGKAHHFQTASYWRIVGIKTQIGKAIRLSFSGNGGSFALYESLIGCDSRNAPGEADLAVEKATRQTQARYYITGDASFLLRGILGSYLRGSSEPNHGYSSGWWWRCGGVVVWWCGANGAREVWDTGETQEP